MFQELRSLADRHAELHTDRGRLEARIEADTEHRARLEMDVASLKSELDHECARSADLKAEAEHQACEIGWLQAALDHAHTEKHRLETELLLSWYRRLFRRSRP